MRSHTASAVPAVASTPSSRTAVKLRICGRATRSIRKVSQRKPICRVRKLELNRVWNYISLSVDMRDQSDYLDVVQITGISYILSRTTFPEFNYGWDDRFTSLSDYPQ